uniref:ANIS5_cation-bd domain-containing protein n=1 Tax=Haemonchus contortus TaxID=6289 RepID=A0A7I4YHL0_HAECO|nr:Protein of unknown function DUF148 domain containing protein [Haemonchus contortus]
MKDVFVLFIVIASIQSHMCDDMADHLGGYVGRGCRKGTPQPLFLKNVTKEARKEYSAILRNRNTTIAEQNSEIWNWAIKYGLQEQVEEYNRNRTLIEQELKQNFTQLVSDLPQILSEFFSIIGNEAQTRTEMKTALGDLKIRNTKAFNVLRFAFSELKPRQQCSRKGKSHGSRGMLARMPKKKMSHKEMAHMMGHMMAMMMKSMHENEDPNDGMNKDSGEDNAFESFDNSDRRILSNSTDEAEDFL